VKSKKIRGWAMQSLARKPVETAKCVFYPGVFNETPGLLFEAHTYFQERSGEEQAVLDDTSKLYYANEMTPRYHATHQRDGMGDGAQSRIPQDASAKKKPPANIA